MAANTSVTRENSRKYVWMLSKLRQVLPRCAQDNSEPLTHWLFGSHDGDWCGVTRLPKRQEQPRSGT
jgi:hypothetical protein